MRKLIIVFLFFPYLAWGNINEKFSELFSEKLCALDIEGCENLLRIWETKNSSQRPLINGLRACILLAKGNIYESNKLMEESLKEMEGIIISSKIADGIRRYYTQAWELDEDDGDEQYFLENFSFKATKIELCKHKHKHKRHSPKQPKGVRFKYWLGISQIVGGCILMPFNPAAGSALILSGTATTGDAVSDALNNKENWEKDLNDRQRIGPDKTFNRQSSFKTCPFTLRI